MKATEPNRLHVQTGPKCTSIIASPVLHSRHARDSSATRRPICPAAPASDLSSFAFVNDDGTLRIRGQTVRLFGIIIPPTDQGCQDNVRPIHCAPRAALALNFKVGTNFVHCDIRERLPNDDVLASCTVNDEDLVAWLIQQG